MSEHQEKNTKGIAGAKARAAALTPAQRSEIAKVAAAKRWAAPTDGVPEARCEGTLVIGDISLDCYVVTNGSDTKRLFHKRGLARALGMKSEGGNVFMRTINRKGLGSAIPENLRQKIDTPIVFKPLSGDPAHGYEASVLIELCDAIWEADRKVLLTPSQKFLAVQAEIIIRSAAKVGIIALVDEATGYIKDKRKEEYRDLFKEFLRDEFSQWEREFPNQFFDLLYRLYNLKRSSGTKHPQFFGKLIRKYIYAPLANSNGAILDMLDERNPVVYTNGGRRHKMFMFLSETVGLPAFRAHLWQVVGIGSISKTKEAFERNFRQAFPQSGDQLDLLADQQ